MSGWMTVEGVQLEVVERGHGRPILWLHGEEGLDPEAPVLAALAAQGNSTISGASLLDRGYENFREKLVSIGAKLH